MFLRLAFTLILLMLNEIIIIYNSSVFLSVFLHCDWFAETRARRMHCVGVRPRNKRWRHSPSPAYTPTPQTLRRGTMMRWEEIKCTGWMERDTGKRIKEEMQEKDAGGSDGETCNDDAIR